jgi:hypothetical protein
MRPAAGAVFYAKHRAARNEADRRPFEVYGYASSTTVHQPFGHSVCDPHRRLLRGGRMFGIGFDIPSPTLSQFQSWPRRVQTAGGNGDPTLSAAFQAGDRRRACGGAGATGNRTGNNRSLARAAGRAARRSIHAGAGAAAQHRPYAQAQSTEGAPSRRSSADVSATAGTLYSRVRRFGSPDAVVLDLPDPAHLRHEARPAAVQHRSAFAIRIVGYPTIQPVAR